MARITRCVPVHHRKLMRDVLPMLLQVMGQVIAPIAVSILVIMIGIILSVPVLTVVGILLLLGSFILAARG